MSQPTKARLIEAGLRMLLERGYNSLGLQAILEETGIPKGSFYHHFVDKEDFALQGIDAYIGEVHTVLDACLGDETQSPLARIRKFFETVRLKYREDGYMGCLMGGLGQELSGTSEVFRQKIEWCFSSIAERLAACVDDAKKRGEIAPNRDSREIANLLVDCWEGAALRSRLRKTASSLDAMLDFSMQALARTAK